MEDSKRPRKKQRVAQEDSNQLLQLPNELHGIISQYYHYPTFHWRVYWKKLIGCRWWEFGIEIQCNQTILSGLDFTTSFHQDDLPIKHSGLHNGCYSFWDNSLRMDMNDEGISFYHVFDHPPELGTLMLHIPSSHHQYRQLRQTIEETLSDLEVALFGSFPLTDGPLKSP